MDFDQFCDALATVKLSEGVHVVPVLKPPRLFLGWCNGDRKFLDVELPSVV